MAFTFFFRDSHTLEQAAKHLTSTFHGSQHLKIWNAGCAMGPETYTFAIILAEMMNPYAFRNVFIDATDIDENENFEGKIRNGVYHWDEIKRVPEDILTKYFTETNQPNYFVIDEELRKRVTYKKHDLLSLKPIDKDYHLVICKNVLLHFQQSERIEVIKMYHSVLLPSGLLVTEQTQQMPDECKHLFEKTTTDANVFRKI